MANQLQVVEALAEAIRLQVRGELLERLRRGDEVDVVAMPDRIEVSLSRGTTAPGQGSSADFSLATDADVTVATRKRDPSCERSAGRSGSAARRIRAGEGIPGEAAARRPASTNRLLRVVARGWSSSTRAGDAQLFSCLRGKPTGVQ